MAIDPTLAVYKTIAGAARVLPHGAMSAMSRAATIGIPSFSPERRLIVERNLERSHGRPLSDSERSAGVRAVFRSYARYYTDTARLPGLSAKVIDEGFSYQGFRFIEDSHARGKGTILVLPHVGGWEWAASWLYKVPKYDVTGVVEALENDDLRQWMEGWRESVGIQVLPLGKGLGSELLRRLKANHILCLMSDRNLGDGGVDVNFFGEQTQLPGGAATLALRTGATIIPVTVYHRGAQNHAICETPIVAERHGKMREDISRITQNIADVMELQIKREPTQWIVLQPNWPSDHAALRSLRDAQGETESAT